MLLLDFIDRKKGCFRASDAVILLRSAVELLDRIIVCVLDHSTTCIAMVEETVVT